MKDKELIEFMKSLRKDFPILKQKVKGHPLVYVDNGATTQKPKVVIDSIREFYSKYNSNVHRGVHSLSEKATEEFEKVRGKVSSFINCSEREVVFCSGTTYALNQVAFGLEDYFKPGDEIVLSEAEHHANIVPWQEVAKKRGLVLKYIPVNSDFELDMDIAKSLISKKTKVVSVAHVSNVLGTINPVKELAKMAHLVGALMVVDGAQSVPHMKVDVKELDCDFMMFSAHKMCGPMGVGVLYGKLESLELLKPLVYGGSMIYEVGFNESSYAEVPQKFEAGTPNVADVIAFGAAIDYLSEVGIENIERYEHLLTEYFLKGISEVPSLTLFGSKKSKNRSGVFAFNFDGIHSHDVSTILDSYGIAIRGGHHCAMPLNEVLKISASSRVSLYFYNTFEEVDFIIECLKKVREDFESGKFLN